ncbi:MAG: MFS transporter [Dehalococcoidia bacterium]
MEPITTGTYPKYRFVILGFLGFANILNVLMMLSLGILLPGISEDLDLSPSEQGWLGSSALLGALIFALPASLWVSRFSAKTVLTAVLFFGAIFVSLQAWAPVFGVLILGRILFGIAMVARQPARVVLTIQWFRPREIIIVNGVLLNVTFGLASVIGFVLTAYLLVWLDGSWRVALTIYSAVFLLIAVAWVIVGRERRSDAVEKTAGTDEGSPLRSLLRYREMWYLGIGMLGVSTMFGALITFWPTLMLERHDISLTTSATILGISGIAEGIGGMAVSLYLVRAGRRDVRRPLVAFLAVLQVASAIGMVSSGSVPALVGLGILHGLGFAVAPIIFTVPFELPGITYRELAVAAGFIEVSIRSGGVLGPLIAGFLQESTGDIQLSLVVTSLCALSLVITAVTLFGKGSKRVTKSSALDTE